MNIKKTQNNWQLELKDDCPNNKIQGMFTLLCQGVGSVSNT